MTSNPDLHNADEVPSRQPATTATEKRNDTTTTTIGHNADALGEEPREIDYGLQRRALRKIDCFLMPAMVIGMSVICPDCRTFFFEVTGRLIDLIPIKGYGLVYWDKVGC